MLVCDIYLWPGGYAERAQPKGHVLIANDGSGAGAGVDGGFGNYDACLTHSGNFYGKPGIYRCGHVANFKRSTGVYVLLERVLSACARGAPLNGPTGERAKRIMATFERGRSDRSELLDKAVVASGEVSLEKQVAALKLERDSFRDRVQELEEMLEKYETK